MSAACHFCGSTPVLADSPMGSPTCEDCRPIRDHVVSMQRGAGGEAVAICQCDWRYHSQFGGLTGSIFRDVAVRSHWRAMIAAAVDHAACSTEAAA